MVDPEKAEMIDKLKTDQKASNKYRVYLEYYKKVKKTISTPDMAQAKAQMDNSAQALYTNFTRITRNDLAHPSEVRMDRIETLMIFISFVKYCKTQYKFINYFNTNSLKEV